MRPRLITIVWLVIGILLAANHNYLRNLDAIKPIISAVLSILLWPLLLLGINLHIH